MPEEQLTELKELRRTTAMPGTAVGSGWTNKAVRAQVAEKFQVTYRQSGRHQRLARLGWSYQRGRKLYQGRTAADHARYERETHATLARLAHSGVKRVPLAREQSNV